MKLRIQKSVFSWSLVEENGSIAAKIKRQKWLGAAKKIIDAKGNVIFTTDIVTTCGHIDEKYCENTRKYIVYKGMKPVATASLTFAENEDGTKTRNFIKRPSLVRKMDVETPYGLWVIQRKNNNSLVITQNDIQIGSVSSFFSFKPIYLDITGNNDAAFWAGIYTLMEYMMHEDDVSVV